MANTAISVNNSKKNLTKQEIAARKVAEESVIQKPVTKPKPFYPLNKLEQKIFNKIKKYNDWFSDGDSLPLTDLSRAYIEREKAYEGLNKLTPSDDVYKEYLKAHKYWEDIVQTNMKKLAISLGDRYKLAYEMSKVIQANMNETESNENKQSEADPVLKLINKY